MYNQTIYKLFSMQIAVVICFGFKGKFTCPNLSVNPSVSQYVSTQVGTYLACLDRCHLHMFRCFICVLSPQVVKTSNNV